MTVYIEYAFLENFLLDGVLLSLALVAAKAPLRWWRLVLSASLGGVFAVVFPLLRLPAFLLTLLKISVGFLLCLLAFGRIKTKKDGSRYAFTSLFFFLFTFSFGGAITGVFDRVSPVALLIGFAVLSLISLFLIGKLYAKRALNGFLYDCRILYKQRSVAVSGFLDSGNRAQKYGVPVCFVSPELIYDLFSEEIFENGGQVCDELSVSTLNGEKKYPLYKGDIEIVTKEGVHKKREVYFAPSANMISREYKVLLHSRIFEG